MDAHPNTLSVIGVLVAAAVLWSQPSPAPAQNLVWDVEHQCYRQAGAGAACGPRWDVGQRAFIGDDTGPNRVESEGGQPSRTGAESGSDATSSETDTAETLRKFRDRVERVRALSGVAQEVLGLSLSDSGEGGAATNE